VTRYDDLALLADEVEDRRDGGQAGREGEATTALEGA
jgi:hypothetical protein